MAIGHKGHALQTYWTIAQTGTPCEISTDGRCVTDGAGNYETNEQCTMTAQVPMTLEVTEFTTEDNFDYIEIGASRYSGSNGPNAVQPAGRRIHDDVAK